MAYKIVLLQGTGCRQINLNNHIRNGLNVDIALPNVLAPSNVVLHLGSNNQGFTLNDIADLVALNGINNDTLIYVNAHGGVFNGAHHVEMATNNIIPTEQIFTNLTGGVPLNVFLMSCRSGHIHNENFINNLPNRSFVGAYAPHDQFARMEIMEKIIIKSVENVRSVGRFSLNMPTRARFWAIAPLNSTTFIYRPTNANAISHIHPAPNYPHDIVSQRNLIALQTRK
ncbi:MAG: hypothetical protein K2P99_04860, partial [Burkholderiales bacterium]|nr:hypothetical protein [Burkholderiales bacterium]